MNNLVFVRALNFAQSITQTTTLEAATAQISQLARDFGFSNFILTAFTEPGSFAAPFMIASDWNQEWQKRYLENNYIADDPVILRFAKGAEPFFWHETRNDPETTHKGLQILDEASAFHMADGVLIPVYGPSGCEGTLSLGGEQADLSTEDLKALHFAGIYAYAHSFKIALKKSTRTKTQISLTKREVECLKWSAAGKTSSEIANLLNISKHTADWYLKEATTKLGAGNRTHAVAEAFRRKIII